MTLLTNAALKRAPGTLKSFTTRLTKPIHVDETIRICGAAPVDGVMNCWIANQNGDQCGIMDLSFA